MRTAGMKRRLGYVGVAVTLLASACSGGTTTLTEGSVGATGEAEPTAVVEEPTAQPESTATPLPEPTAVPTPGATPTPTEAPSLWAADLDVGDCFDSAPEAGSELLVGPEVDCQGEHEYEIFFKGVLTEGPDEPYPTDPAFTNALFDDFCHPATSDFAGASWDVIPFDTTVWTPTPTDWQAGDRTFLCTAEAGLRDENVYKIGTAAGGTLVSDEGIIARSTVAGQRDFYFSFQGSTIYPLTQGDFELPNLSPVTLGSGFLFASPAQDAADGDLSAAAYNYDYDTAEIIQIETGLDGWELASPHFVLDIPAFVFAARETEDDDWDIYLSRTADDVLALTDSPGDDRWPTLTPDGSQIVYHASGDIWIMNVDGSDKRQLTTDPGGDYESAVSPDGSLIAFASDRSGNDDIWLMNIDGSDQRNLSNHPANDAWPFFSRDGSRIYFQTDRLGVRSNIMLMELDGSNQSYYSFEFMTNAALLPDAVTQRFAAELPSVADVLDAGTVGVVPGPEGERAEVAHSSGRLIATLPGGWEYEELVTDDVASIVAAPSIADFSTSWAADGALITLIEADEAADFSARLDEAAAATDTGCVATGDSVQIDGSRSTTLRRYDCGESSKAIIAGVYQSDAGLGVLYEGQWDGDPDPDADENLITAIGQALQWG